MDRLKSNSISLFILACLVCVGLSASTAYASTEKDTTVRLNVMNLDCSVDQIYAGNSPSYIVTPQGCTEPPVIEVIGDKIIEQITPEFIFTDDGKLQEIPAENTPSPLTESIIAPQTSGLLMPTPQTVADAVPQKVSQSEQTTAVVFASVAIGATVVTSVIVADVLLFNAQLVQGIGSVSRRVIQAILGIVGK